MNGYRSRMELLPAAFGRMPDFLFSQRMRRSAETPPRLMNDFAPLEQTGHARVVTAATALDKQIERYRQMTGEQQLKIALDLHEMSCDVARAGIRRQHPDANEAEVEHRLRRRLELASSEKQVSEVAIARMLASTAGND